jgi:riboflavin kinase/FMN adenylyltransferase
MQAIQFEKGCSQPLSLALGFFDSIHIGHKKLIDTAKLAAERLGCKSAIFTFSNNPYLMFGKDTELVYDFKDRLKVLSELCLDYVIYKEFDKDFMATPPEAFLQSLNNLFKISYVVCGFDYRFGSKHQGTPKLLEEFFAANGIGVTVVGEVECDNKKASSTYVRRLLSDGDINGANRCLGAPYRVYGLVERGYAVGRRLGYPTVNIKIDKDRPLLLSGVYSVYVVIDGVRYEGVANVGDRPTFDDAEQKIEAHLFDFCGNLYEKNITVYFKDFIRGITKFKNEQELRLQIIEDIKAAKKGNI